MCDVRVVGGVGKVRIVDIAKTCSESCCLYRDVTYLISYILYYPISYLISYLISRVTFVAPSQYWLRHHHGVPGVSVSQSISSISPPYASCLRREQKIGMIEYHGVTFSNAKRLKMLAKLCLYSKPKPYSSNPPPI